MAYEPLTVTSITTLVGTPTIVGDETALSDESAATYVDFNSGEIVGLIYSDVPAGITDVQLVVDVESIAAVGTGLPTFNLQFIIAGSTAVVGQFGYTTETEFRSAPRTFTFTLGPAWYASLEDAPGEDTWGSLTGFAPATWAEFWELFRTDGYLQVHATRSSNLLTSLTTRVFEARLSVQGARPVIRQYPSTSPSAWGGGPRQYPAPTRRPFGGFQ